MNLADRVATHASNDPEWTALRLADGTTYSYAQLDDAATRAAASLSAGGLRGRRFALGSPDPFAHCAWLLAGLASGCDVLPLLPQLHPAELETVFRHAGVAATVAALPEPGRDRVRPDGEPGQLLHFTSGSYGAKKIVVRPHDGVVDESLSIAQALGLTADDVVLVASPLAHGFGCGMLRATLAAGATLAHAPGADVISQLNGIRALLGGGATVITGVPFVFRSLLRKPALTVAGDLRAFAGGAPLTSRLAEQWDEATSIPLRQEYGLGEGGIVAFGDAGAAPESIGKPIPHVRLVIAAGTDTEVGELIVHRPHPPTRYLLGDAPETFRSDGGIRTGDLARIDEHGYYYMVGRTKSIINVAGNKVVPLEVEMLLMEIAGVDEATVLSCPDPVTGERPAAVVQARADGPTASACHAYLKERLAPHKLPQTIMVVDEMPMTPSGKADREAMSDWLTRSRPS